MPYDKLTELPDNVKDNLPKHAQEIYLAAYNNAWDNTSRPRTAPGTMIAKRWPTR